MISADEPSRILRNLILHLNHPCWDLFRNTQRESLAPWFVLWMLMQQIPDIYSSVSLSYCRQRTSGLLLLRGLQWSRFKCDLEVEVQCVWAVLQLSQADERAKEPCMAVNRPHMHELFSSWLWGQACPQLVLGLLTQWVSDCRSRSINSSWNQFNSSDKH